MYCIRFISRWAVYFVCLADESGWLALAVSSIMEGLVQYLHVMSVHHNSIGTKDESEETLNTANIH